MLFQNLKHYFNPFIIHHHHIFLLTGHWTGAVYKDLDLLHRGMRGEGRVDRSVFVIKTHNSAGKSVGGIPMKKSEFDRAILIYRNPKDAVLAEFNRRKAGHTGTTTSKLIQGDSNTP